MTNRIEPRSGVAFRMEAGQNLTIIDPEGGQVSDLIAYGTEDVRESLSNGRTFDYEETLKLTTGNRLWSNRSNPMLEIVADDVGTHDFLLTPCSEATFEHFYPDKPVHRGCHGNLAAALEPFGIGPDQIGTAFNVFMNVPFDGNTGRLQVDPPRSEAGEKIVLRALMDCIVGITACSAYASNGGTFKPIDY
ncbi:MAG: urea carboxylase-associated family protein, partial [Erythrobacter sp.]|nr:urea carboxylase-associated family protein [Erythrobacter sp.]